MISRPSRAADDDELILDASVEVIPPEPAPLEAEFSAIDWSDEPGLDEKKRAGGGRSVLALFLGLLALGWLGFVGWSAGRSLPATGLDPAEIARWLAVATGPLALLGLVWLTFGRTWRRETDRFTRSVARMRAEASALHDVLNALSAQIDQHHGALGVMAGDLMTLGDDTSTRLAKATAELGASAAELRAHGEAVDRAAASARGDMGVMLSDLPMVEAKFGALGEQLREAASSALENSARYQAQVEQLAGQTSQADEIVRQASQRLLADLGHIEAAGSNAAARVTEAADLHGQTIDALLARSADALEQVRAGIDQQSEAVAALLARAEGGMSGAGRDAIDALDGLGDRIAAHSEASRRMVDDLGAGLAGLEGQFAAFAQAGDERASTIGALISRLRDDFAALGQDAGANDQAILAVSERMAVLRAGVDELSAALGGELASALGEAERASGRIADLHVTLRPDVVALRDAIAEAGERATSSEQSIARQQMALVTLSSAVDASVGAVEQRLADLGQQLRDVGQVGQESGPALIDALLQVREAASRAAENARRAIAEVIPQSASALEAETRAALERAVGEVIGDKLGEIDRMAAAAMKSAQAASERLTAQMLSIGQTATALEDHLERQRQAALSDDSETFARRVAMLMESLNSASIDVEKILSDDVDEKAWSRYLKGNRGVFTRRAVRLIDSGQARGIANHYASDPEFHASVNRYVHDFEAMLRRILAERDGGIIAASLMTSDMGKLYAALAPAVDRRG